MIGQVFNDVSQIGDSVKFTFKSHPELDYITFTHFQDCCESVYIESIAGDLSDLENSPILIAAEVSDSYDRSNSEGNWTFYRFSTIKGSVVIRWIGESNGYYSTDVHIEITEK